MLPNHAEYFIVHLLTKNEQMGLGHSYTRFQGNQAISVYFRAQRKLITTNHSEHESTIEYY